MQVPAKSFLLVSAAVAALLWSCSGKEPFTAEAQSVKNRKPAADFTLRDANGTAVKLSDYRGKVVLLNFWATWCGPCAAEMPWFEEFRQTYASQGFQVVGVSIDDDGWKSVTPFLAQRHIDYPIVLGDEALTASYGDISALPRTLLIDRTGRIASIHVGLIEKDQYEQAIRSVLARK